MNILTSIGLPIKVERTLPTLAAKQKFVFNRNTCKLHELPNKPTPPFLPQEYRQTKRLLYNLQNCRWRKCIIMSSEEPGKASADCALTTAILYNSEVVGSHNIARIRTFEEDPYIPKETVIGIMDGDMITS